MLFERILENEIQNVKKQSCVQICFQITLKFILKLFLYYEIKQYKLHLNARINLLLNIKIIVPRINLYFIFIEINFFCHYLIYIYVKQLSQHPQQVIKCNNIYLQCHTKQNEQNSNLDSLILITLCNKINFCFISKQKNKHNIYITFLGT